MRGSTNADVMTTDTSTALAGKQDKLTPEYVQNWTTDITLDTNYSNVERYGKILIINIVNATIPAGDSLLIGNLPTIKGAVRGALFNGTSVIGWYANDGWTGVRIYNGGSSASGLYGQIILILA